MGDDWRRSLGVLRGLQTQLLTAALDSHQRHDVGNILAIVQANIEGMADGLLEPTPQRIKNVEDALAEASNRLRRSPR